MNETLLEAVRLRRAAREAREAVAEAILRMQTAAVIGDELPRHEAEALAAFSRALEATAKLREYHEAHRRPLPAQRERVHDAELQQLIARQAGPRLDVALAGGAVDYKPVFSGGRVGSLTPAAALVIGFFMVAVFTAWVQQ